jgi:DNA processing protein
MLYEVAMTLIPGIGNVLVKQLMSYAGSAEKLFKMPKGKLMKIPGIGEKLATVIISNPQVLKIAEQQIEIAEKTNTEIIFYTSPKYPQRLKNLHDAPVLLFWQGNTSLNHGRTIGIVGTRSASEYGKMMTEKIIEDIKHHNPLIISGLAYGIDIAAHKAALKHGVETIGIMGNGLQKIYPHLHTKVADQMKTQGGILTEYLFGVEPDAPHFPNRNRIIAGLSDVLIVVETSNKGGTLITAELAVEYKKPILAVPANIGTKTSEGCLDLLQKQKAFIYTKSADIEQVAGWLNTGLSISEKDKLRLPPADLNTEEQKVYDLLHKHTELQIDEIAWQSQIPINQIASILLNLEFKGVVKALIGKKFRLEI